MNDYHKMVLLRDPKTNHKDHKYLANTFCQSVFWFFSEHVFSKIA